MSGSNKRQLSKSSVAYIALGVILITLMAVVGTSAFLRIHEIRVEGATVYSNEEIIEASGLSIGDNMLLINARNASQRIREELPFISEAVITRELPDVVRIDITESTAVALIAFDGEMLVTDVSGRVIARSSGGVFTLPGINTDELIEIRGVEINEAIVGGILRAEFLAEMKLQNMQDILSAMEREDMIKDVSYLDVSNNTNIHFGYLGRYRVILGDRNYLRIKLEILPSRAEQFAHRNPNTPGEINMSEVSDVSSEVKFRPTQ